MRLLRGLLQRRREPSSEESTYYAYAVYWTKTVRAWQSDRRRSALQAVRAIQERPDFRATLHERLYHLDDVNSSAHAGASLIALERVLHAMESGSSGGPADE
jgi:hypothetical protein